MLFDKYAILDIRGMRVPFGKMKNVLFINQRLVHQIAGIFTCQKAKVDNYSSGQQESAPIWGRSLKKPQRS
jgi:hypothetical protein